MTLDFHPREPAMTVTEHAAEWLDAFEDGPLDETQRRAFVAWLKRAPTHIEAFLELSLLHEQLGGSPALQVDLDALLAEADATRTPLDGQPLPSVAPPATATTPHVATPRRRRRPWAIAASVLVLVTGSLIGGLLWMDRAERSYRTGFGEQRSIPLADGTVVTLNTESHLRVRLDEHGRHADLLAGEVMFDVAKDKARPFTVTAGPVDVRVVGTRFNLYRQPDATTVTVIEGIVDVTPHRAPSPPRGEGQGEGANTSPHPAPHTPHPAKARLTAGQKLDIAAAAPVPPQLALAPQPARVDQATAWTTRRVIFENERLDDVLLQFNRYNPRPLVVTDADLAARQISGVFKVDDIDLLLAFLKRQHDIRVIPTETELQIERAR
ncbi:FecR domain-containing protein [Flagellatimonas centrodinii]|uniref:FecR family protein n=1 Tax=Flagellatimonas centrodinii TaxID=2806210 RepID=UPI001FEDB3E9|nr:FecR domain-containing protein [Flagellatimonas centrodinii]ULQ47877.1 FecR domain-containing protein [Flagellatimonas centrodinii]